MGSSSESEEEKRLLTPTLRKPKAKKQVAPVAKAAVSNRKHAYHQAALRRKHARVLPVKKRLQAQLANKKPSKAAKKNPAKNLSHKVVDPVELEYAMEQAGAREFPSIEDYLDTCLLKAKEIKERNARIAKLNEARLAIHSSTIVPWEPFDPLNSLICSQFGKLEGKRVDLDKWQEGIHRQDTAIWIKRNAFICHEALFEYIGEDFKTRAKAMSINMQDYAAINWWGLRGNCIPLNGIWIGDDTFGNYDKQKAIMSKLLFHPIYENQESEAFMVAFNQFAQNIDKYTEAYKNCFPEDWPEDPTIEDDEPSPPKRLETPQSAITYCSDCGAAVLKKYCRTPGCKK